MSEAATSVVADEDGHRRSFAHRRRDGLRTRWDGRRPGLPVGWGVAAVDPSVIPLGTHMTVPGYGEAVAADVGGAVRGAVIDLWFPTVAQANAWGRRSVTVILH